MGHRILRINCNEIVSREAFHDVFRDALGFPDFYGRNMDAWIDCMSSLDVADAGMTKVHVSEGEVLVLTLIGMRSLRERLPDLARDLEECAAFVNWRRVEQGDSPVLALSYCD